MIPLLLIACILVTTILGVVFTYFSKCGVDTFQAIVLNYWVCVAMGSLVYGGWSIPNAVWAEPWFAFAASLSVLFISGFFIGAKTYQHFGIAFTTIIQKISLIIPVVIAIVCFGESATVLKIAGVLCAIAAIIMVNMPFGKRESALPRRSIVWALPALTFLFSGTVEVTLYIANAQSFVDTSSPTFISTAFLLAGCIGLLVLGPQWLSRRRRFGRREWLGGCALGVFNFFSMYWLLWLLHHGMDGSVLFPLNNIGVVAVSAAIGVWFFQEVLNSWRKGGLVMAVIAILLIALGNGS